MMTWEILGTLARSGRPGYPYEDVEPSVVGRWVADARALGILSIICLLGEDQLPFYGRLSSDLISYYRSNGFQVEHVPAKDHQTPPLPPAALERVWLAFQVLPKPVLVHCSAGIDRTGRAVEHIRGKLAAS